MALLADNRQTGRFSFAYDVGGDYVRPHGRLALRLWRLHDKYTTNDTFGRDLCVLTGALPSELE